LRAGQGYFSRPNYRDRVNQKRVRQRIEKQHQILVPSVNYGVLRSLALISILILKFYLGVGMTIWINDNLPESWLCQDNLSLTIVPTTIEEIRTNCFKYDSQGEESPIITATVIMGNSVICDAFARVIWQGELAIPTTPPSLIWYDPPVSGDVAFLGIGDISNRVLAGYSDFPQATWLKVTFLDLVGDEC
jgi:hypothetical protein